jgi:hypothetical protein
MFLMDKSASPAATRDYVVDGGQREALMVKVSVEHGEPQAGAVSVKLQCSAMAYCCKPNLSFKDAPEAWARAQMSGSDCYLFNRQKSRLFFIDVTLIQIRYSSKMWSVQCPNIGSQASIEIAAAFFCFVG